MPLSNHNPLLSVIVVTYNQEGTIKRTLDSILYQKHNYPIEIIIGEDASSDGTRYICEQYEQQHKDIIKLIPKAPNKGVLKNYADCLALAQGTYVGSCAGDDWWSNPDKIALQIDFLNNHPDFGVVHGNYTVFDEKNQKLMPVEKRNPPQGEVYKDLFKYCFVYAPTAIYRRYLLQYVEFDKLRECGVSIEDYPMWLEMAIHTKFWYIDQPLVTYSVLEHSLSHSPDIEKKLAFIEQTNKIREFYLEKYPNSGVDKSYSDLFYYRTVYMELLTYHQYRRSFEYVDKIGFSKPLKIFLKTYVGAWMCSIVIKSKIYQKIKQR